MSRKFVRTEPGERIDQPDFKHLAHEGQMDAVEPLGEDFIIGQDRTRVAGEVDQPKHFVIKGFGLSNPSGSLLRIEGGVAVCGYSRSGTAHYGQILSVDEAATIEVGGVPSPASIHGVYVRLGQDEVDVENRAKWNPFAGTPVEEVQMMPTRYQDVLDATVSLTSPGPEWMRIGLVTPSTMAFSSLRDFFFEGREDAGFVLGNADWGYAQDRDAARATNGVFGLRRHVMGVLRQLQDIIGTAWYTSPPISLLETKNNRLDRRGQSAPTVAEGELSGHLYPSAGDTLEIGSYARRFLRGIFNRLDVGPENLASSLLPRLTMAAPDGTAAPTAYTLLLDLPRFSAFPWAGTATATWRRWRVYRDPGVLGISLTVNASWNDSLTRWEPDDGSQPSYIYTLDATTWYGYVHDSTGGAWSDSYTAGNWDRREFVFTPSIGTVGAIYGTASSWRQFLFDRGLVRLSEIQFDSDSTRHGSAGSATGGTYTVTLSGANQPLPAALVHDLTPVAWAHIEWNGGSDTLTVHDSVGFASVRRVDNDDLEVVLSFDMRNNVGTPSSSSGILQVTPAQSSAGALSSMLYPLQTGVRTFSLWSSNATAFNASTNQRYYLVVMGRGV